MDTTSFAVGDRAAKLQGLDPAVNKPSMAQLPVGSNLAVEKWLKMFRDNAEDHYMHGC